MPTFCKHCGADEIICQVCGTIFCSNPECIEGRKSKWVEGKGNVCELCTDKKLINKIMGCKDD